MATGSAYASMPLDQLLRIVHAGAPATLQADIDAWQARASELAAHNATLGRLLAQVGSFWRGASADAFVSQVGRVVAHGADVAGRASASSPSPGPFVRDS